MSLLWLSYLLNQPLDITKLRHTQCVTFFRITMMSPLSAGSGSIVTESLLHFVAVCT